MNCFVDEVFVDFPSGEVERNDSLSEDAKSGNTRIGKSTNTSSTKQFIDDEGASCLIKL